MSKYDTNLASEFYVLSMLYRLGFDASLTLGNKKSVDIVVVRGRRSPITIDVKGLAGKTGWPVDNFRGARANHWLAFVTFLNRIADPEALPEVYVVPSSRVRTLIYHAPGGRKVVSLSRMRDRGAAYRDGWRKLR